MGTSIKSTQGNFALKAKQITKPLIFINKISAEQFRKSRAKRQDMSNGKKNHMKTIW